MRGAGKDVLAYTCAAAHHPSCCSVPGLRGILGWKGRLRGSGVLDRPSRHGEGLRGPIVGAC